MTTLYGIPNCDTVKKARKWLQESDLDYVFHDYKKLGCDKKLASLLLSKFDLELLINKRGTTWRKLPDQDKENLNKTNAIELMAANPSVIKRPILQAGKNWLIGFDAASWTQELT